MLGIKKKSVELFNFNGQDYLTLKEAEKAKEQYEINNPSVRELLLNKLKHNNEGWDDVVSWTLSVEELDTRAGRYDYDMPVFTVWTHNTVYFSCAEIDHGCGAVLSVPRNPIEK